MQLTEIVNYLNALACEIEPIDELSESQSRPPRPHTNPNWPFRTPYTAQDFKRKQSGIHKFIPIRDRECKNPEGFKRCLERCDDESWCVNDCTNWHCKNLIDLDAQMKSDAGFQSQSQTSYGYYFTRPAPWPTDPWLLEPRDPRS